MKLRYKQKLFLWFGVIFLLFTAGIAVFDHSRARRYNTNVLEEKLDTYAETVNNAVDTGEPVDSLLKLFPPDIRVTIIDRQGNVLYDNAVGNVATLDNHAGRQEIVEAEKYDHGSFVRLSATNKMEYLYYARDFDERYVRVALPYDIEIKHFLRVDNGFLYFTLLLFAIALIFIMIAVRVFGKSISRLRDFTVAAEENRLDGADVAFPDDELGEVGDRIVRGYRELESSKKRTAHEREKLLQHIQSSEEGVCFYSPAGNAEFYNGLFMQYINILLDKTLAVPGKILDSREFSEINAFLSSSGGTGHRETVVRKHGKEFSVQANMFADKSFEIIIRDITVQEKTRRLKQEMTGNIAHELRTPVTSIRGYLETILDQPLDAEKQRRFISKAYGQTLSLSELISDMGLLTKIEEAPDSFSLGGVDILSTVERVCEDMEIPLRENDMAVSVNIPAGTTVMGNENLLYSIFRNLTDNSIKYAGKGSSITFDCYGADNDFYYFSFSDNGAGIEDERHLSRIFERFYRISEGRTRDSGGSGLGLSIVRNAIAFLKGTISVKNRADGGLEFLIKLRRVTAAAPGIPEQPQ